ncbi:hypothetical protein AbraIFM66950_002721 [Aspergillus brasiliensis]|nr:hypothetical protein AbraIFM66950_002721 [Aspergillus brasiliensis]
MSRFSEELDDNEYKNLHVMAWGSDSLSHWALYLQDFETSPAGTLCHLQVEKKCDGLSITGRAQVSIESRNVYHTKPIRSFAIANASVTISQVEQAANYVFRKQGYERYNLFTRNCQNFAADVIQRLHESHPQTVPASAVRQVPRRGKIETVVASVFRRAPVPCS